MLGFPAMAAKVGNQSSWDTIPFKVTSSGKCPGQRTKVGTL